MRKVEQKMINALRAGRSFNVQNTKVSKRTRVSGGYAQSVYLHDNEIARLEYNHEKAREPFAIMGTLAGWDTVTTRSRLNAICCEFTGRSRFGQKQGVQQFDNNEITKNCWLPIR